MKLRMFLFFILFVVSGYSQEKTEVKKVFYPGGALKTEILYKDGKKNGLEKKYSMAGKLEKETSYINGILYGPQKTYYPSGAVSSEKQFENGEPAGVCIKYYESGQIKEQIPFQQGIRSGIRKIYGEDGKLTKEVIYNDDYISTKEYDAAGDLIKRKIPYKSPEYVGLWSLDKMYFNQQLSVYGYSRQERLTLRMNMADFEVHSDYCSIQGDAVVQSEHMQLVSDDKIDCPITENISFWTGNYVYEVTRGGKQLSLVADSDSIIPITLVFKRLKE